MSVPTPQFSRIARQDPMFVELVRNIIHFNEIDVITLKLMSKGDLIYFAMPEIDDRFDFTIQAYILESMSERNETLSVRSVRGPHDVLSFTFSSLNMRHGQLERHLARAFQSYRSALAYAVLVENTMSLYDDSCF